MYVSVEPCYPTQEGLDLHHHGCSSTDFSWVTDHYIVFFSLVQANLGANTYAVNGHAETKSE